MSNVKKLSWGLLALTTPFAISGCGGSDAGLGHNALIRVHLERTDSTQKMTDFELYITKNADATLNTLDPEDYISTLNRPSWCDEYVSGRATTDLQIDFRTRSSQPPYFVFVKVPNTGAAYETLRFSIDVDGTSGKKITQNLTINTTQRLTAVKINRSSADY